MAQIQPSTPRFAFTHLRHLTIYVDEPDTGSFFWVLIESFDDSAVWKELQGSEETYGTWIDAHDAGVVELHKLVEDERIGPRAPGAEDDSANPVG